MNNLALGYGRFGQYREANKLSLKALKLTKDFFRKDHPEQYK